MSFGVREIPPELQSCPPELLERYVRTRILAHAGSASVSRRLGISSESIRQAFAESLTEAPLRSIESDATAGGPPLELAFGHDCQSLGCLEPNCALCAQNPNRRCSSSFSGKYLSGDVLKAKCGASIRVQIINRATLEPLKGREADDIHLEMCILDGKAYQALQDAGREQFEDDVESCVIALNNQGKELLVPGRGASHNDEKWVVVQLVRGEAHLPDLMVTGSSEALLSGQKPPFRLYVRAMSSSNSSRALDIRFCVSDAFVVATPRVRTAAKAEIPHLEDHVSKLHAVGNMTQNKLLDINAAATAVGVYNIKVPYNVVTKVGQFREVVEVAERDPQLCETLKKVLKLTRGWEVARDHALMAVSTDNQMRIWYARGSAGSEFQDGGLLFKCHLGSVDLENPIGLLKRKADDEQQQPQQQTTLEAILIQRLPASQKENIKRLQKKAAQCWWQPGHPGWAIWPVDTQHFLQDMSMPTGMLTADHLMSTTPTEPQQKHERPVTRAAAHAAQIVDVQSPMSIGSAAAENALQAHGHHITRSSTPSEGGTSLDGWMTTSQHGPPPSHNAVARASTRDLRFPAQPSPHASPVWTNPTPSYTSSRMASGQLPSPMTQGDDVRPLHWDSAVGPRQLPSDVVDRTATTASAFLRPVNSPDDPPPYWSREDASFGPPADGGIFSSAPQTADPWSVDLRQQQRTHLPSAYAGMRDYSVLGTALNPLQGNYPGMLPMLQQTGMAPMPSSGTVRKRESSHNSVSTGSESRPLASPFGHPEMQNAELPVPAPIVSAPMLDARMSSGMEPASAKRPHTSPAVLQERLSNIFGRQVGARELSMLIPNFSELLEDPGATHDLPSMSLTTSDLASLMDTMLEPRNARGQAMTHVRADSGQLGGSARDQNPGPASELLKFNSYTYGDLAEAVDMMHEGRAPQPANAGLDRPRSSSMLMEYMAARLGGSESQLLVGHGSSPRQLAGGPASEGLEERRSGLETMQVIQQALPAPANSAVH